MESVAGRAKGSMHQNQKGCTYALRADLVEKLQGLLAPRGSRDVPQYEGVSWQHTELSQSDILGRDHAKQLVEYSRKEKEKAGKVKAVSAEGGGGGSSLLL